MSFIVVGTNHRFSPIELREKLSFPKKRLKDALSFLKEKKVFKGAVILSTRYGIVLIFDEVITGFRLSYSGAQGYFGVKPDLTCLGKIIGGGLPVGAFGGKREIMQHLAPEGSVYRAGTLSGNPIAVTAGIATIKLLKK